SKVRKQLSGKFAYIIEELLAEIDRNPEKKSYFDTIIEKLFELDQVEDLIIVLSQTIQVLIIDHLHVVGDIYDRGRYPDRILNRLMAFPNLDIQWGNHDVTWMGAASGSYLCMVNVIRIAARYNNITLIEDRYGINLRRLVDYSRRYYEPLPSFVPILDGEEMTHPDELDLLNMIQQATAILQFKLEAQLIDRRPEFQMHNRQLINQVNYKDLSISIK
ncbi:fructose-bisphosphatase class III, partial [Streptococcus agalactiae]|nr:fructose-bisphosphatase class III [Streptococcus agalactiae]